MNMIDYLKYLNEKEKDIYFQIKLKNILIIII